MPINRKAKGSRNERKTRKLLENSGYWVIKAGGSLGVWDLVGLGNHAGALVQVKTNRKPSKAEMNAMKDFPAPMYCSKYLYIWHDQVKEPEIMTID